MSSTRKSSLIIENLRKQQMNEVIASGKRLDGQIIR